MEYFHSSGSYTMETSLSTPDNSPVPLTPKTNRTNIGDSSSKGSTDRSRSRKESTLRAVPAPDMSSGDSADDNSDDTASVHSHADSLIGSVKIAPPRGARWSASGESDSDEERADIMGRLGLSHRKGSRVDIQPRRPSAQSSVVASPMQRAILQQQGSPPPKPRGSILAYQEPEYSMADNPGKAAVRKASVMNTPGTEENLEDRLQIALMRAASTQQPGP
eukprot:TRINITY_DN10297_c0_g1_i1.p2 TRINITY_DN10297_c0_g1~~TRINITY_DN10297_c0_g1_i1.p2  ORF type:complete len:220 (+),score=50.75 TRINITY_DN10297_c0_g1_i1:3039-3698(+)